MIAQIRNYPPVFKIDHLNKTVVSTTLVISYSFENDNPINWNKSLVHFCIVIINYFNCF